MREYFFDRRIGRSAMGESRTSPRRRQYQGECVVYGFGHFCCPHFTRIGGQFKVLHTAFVWTILQNSLFDRVLLSEQVAKLACRQNTKNTVTC